MQRDKIPYQRSIYVCTNDRQGERPSCGDQNGEEVFRKLREIAKTRGIHPRIRVGQAKCLGQCTRGTTVMIYPDNVWISGVTLENLHEIVEECFKEPAENS
jgi:(2Fe-2S) ferredoxin